MPKVPVIDLSQCVVCDACLELCPHVFVRNEAGYMEVLDRDTYPEDCVDEAINCCPTDCIQWEESS